MFERNKGDYITRSEARAYVAGLDERVTTLQTEGERQLADLQRRVSALETLAEQLRGGRAPLPTRTAASGDALTKQDAEAALRHLESQGAVAFERLERKIDYAVQAVVVDERDDVRMPEPTGVDYDAVAFGLAEINRKVKEAFGNDAHILDRIATEHRGAVQYFADVFAKADPSFDEEEFRAQAGA